jgi:hypothetical protein
VIETSLSENVGVSSHAVTGRWVLRAFSAVVIYKVEIEGAIARSGSAVSFSFKSKRWRSGGQWYGQARTFLQ